MYTEWEWLNKYFCWPSKMKIPFPHASMPGLAIHLCFTWLHMARTKLNFEIYPSPVYMHSMLPSSLPLYDSTNLQKSLANNVFNRPEKKHFLSSLGEQKVWDLVHRMTRCADAHAFVLPGRGPIHELWRPIHRLNRPEHVTLLRLLSASDGYGIGVVGE